MIKRFAEIPDMAIDVVQTILNISSRDTDVAAEILLDDIDTLLELARIVEPAKEQPRLVKLNAAKAYFNLSLNCMHDNVNCYFHMCVCSSDVEQCQCVEYMIKIKKYHEIF